MCCIPKTNSICFAIMVAIFDFQDGRLFQSISQLLCGVYLSMLSGSRNSNVPFSKAADGRDIGFSRWLPYKNRFLSISQLVADICSKSCSKVIVKKVERQLKNNELII